MDPLAFLNIGRYMVSWEPGDRLNPLVHVILITEREDMRRITSALEGYHFVTPKKSHEGIGHHHFTSLPPLPPPPPPPPNNPIVRAYGKSDGDGTETVTTEQLSMTTARKLMTSGTDTVAGSTRVEAQKPYDEPTRRIGVQK